MEHNETLRNFYYATNFQFEDSESYFKLRGIIEDIIRYYESIIPEDFDIYEDEKLRRLNMERGEFRHCLRTIQTSFNSSNRQKEKAFNETMNLLNINFNRFNISN